VLPFCKLTPLPTFNEEQPLSRRQANEALTALNPKEARKRLIDQPPSAVLTLFQMAINMARAEVPVSKTILFDCKINTSIGGFTSLVTRL
jgi:hypothetical protein